MPAGTRIRDAPTSVTGAIFNGDRSFRLNNRRADLSSDTAAYAMSRSRFSGNRGYDSNRDVPFRERSLDIASVADAMGDCIEPRCENSKEQPQWSLLKPMHHSA